MEDDAKLSSMLKELLETAGFACITAMSVKDAYAKLREGKFDVALLDWVLGDSSGREVVKLCRERHPLMPIIVVSGATEMDVRTDALVAEADSFLQKPFGGAALLSHIEWWLKRQKTTPTLSLPRHEGEVIPLQEFQWRYVSHVVTLCNNNLSLAAERLGLHRHTVGKILRIGNPREIGSPCTSGNQLEKQQ